MRILIVSMMCLWQLNANADEKTDSVCANEQTYNCLKENFKNLAKADEALFYKILNKVRDEAGQCASVSDTKKFLELFPLVGGSADIEEYFAKAMEKTILKNKPSCFVEAYSKLAPSAQKAVLRDLSQPVFISESEVRESISSIKNQKKLSSSANDLLRSLDKLQKNDKVKKQSS